MSSINYTNVPCLFCNATVDSGCTTKAGKPTSTHKPRIDAAIAVNVFEYAEHVEAERLAEQRCSGRWPLGNGVLGGMSVRLSATTLRN